MTEPTAVEDAVERVMKQALAINFCSPLHRHSAGGRSQNRDCEYCLKLEQLITDALDARYKQGRRDALMLGPSLMPCAGEGACANASRNVSEQCDGCKYGKMQRQALAEIAEGEG